MIRCRVLGNLSFKQKEYNELYTTINSVKTSFQRGVDQ